MTVLVLILIAIVLAMVAAYFLFCYGEGSSCVTF